jgi:hypothetical protein
MLIYVAGSGAMSDVLTIASFFPGRDEEIRRLADANETFRSLCADLAEVTRILGSLSLDPSRTEETKQYRELLGDLVAEVGRSLRDPLRQG